MLFYFLFIIKLFSSEFCTDSSGACSVEGGFFSKQELKNVLKLDTEEHSDVRKEVLENKIYLYFFYSYDCPHCKKAHLFLEELKKSYSNLIIKQFEIKKNDENLKYFYKVAASYNVKPMGVPTFFVGEKHFVGFHDTVTCNAIINEIKKMRKEDCVDDKTQITVPMFGTVDVNLISLPSFTFYIGLLDGLNPCAIWVLMFLLGLMVYAGSRKKVLFIGATFIFASGLVYFIFMLAWFNFFSLIGYSNIVTILLGVVALIMGLINVKELFFFKKGVSLMIPESAKPKLFKKARTVLNEKNKFLAFIGTVALAFFVNLIELGCTVGLPAIYTRILSLRELSSSVKVLYIAFYNLAYIIPLIIIVSIFTYSMGHFKFEEKHGKILKLVSGILMLVLGTILIFYPKLLVIS